MSFTVPTSLPTINLPSIPDPSVITSTLNGLIPPVPDAKFLQNVLDQANLPFTGDASDKVKGLFTNPLFDHMQLVDQAIGSLKPLTSLASAADALKGAPGGAADALTGVIGHMKDLTTMFSNMASNIVPVQLDMNPLIKSAIGGMSSIGSQSAEAMKSVTPFIQKMGIPSMGTVLNQAASEFNLNQLKGTVDAANPLPLMAKYSSMLADMAKTALNFLSTVQNAIQNVLTAAVTGFHDAITGLLSTVESSITSFAAPIASFGSDMFNSIKDQMATGTATLMRHLTENIPAFEFNITGAINGVMPAANAAFSGLVTPSFASILKQNPSPGKQISDANASSAQPTPPATNVASDTPQPTQTQKDALKAAQDMLDADLKTQLKDANAAADAFNAWMTSVNYQSVKNNKDQSPSALAQYQALKSQAMSNADYVKQGDLGMVIKQNQACLQMINTLLNSSTMTNAPSDNKWLYKKSAVIGGTTYNQYVIWKDGVAVNDKYPGTYGPA